MSILSTLNKLTGKQDKNVLAALNSLTGKTADDIEEAMGNLGSGGGDEGSGTKLIPIRFVWDEELNKSGIEFTQEQINKILKKGIQSTFFWKWDGDETAGKSWWGDQTEIEPGVFQGEAPVGAIVELVYTSQSDFDSDLKHIDIDVGGGLADPLIGRTPSIFDIVPVYTQEEDGLLSHSFVVPERSSVTFPVGAVVSTPVIHY